MARQSKLEQSKAALRKLRAENERFKPMVEAINAAKARGDAVEINTLTNALRKEMGLPPIPIGAPQGT